MKSTKRFISYINSAIIDTLSTIFKFSQVQSSYKIYAGKLFQPQTKRVLIAFIPSATVSALTGLLWPGILMGVILLTYLYLVLPILRSDSLGNTAKGLVMLLLVFSVVILLRVFVLEVYQVAGKSMEDTFFDGDRIIVSKYNYGPLLPSTISDDNGRLQGMHGIERNDVVSFTLKAERHSILKRVVALPGDTITIKHGAFSLGRQKIADPGLSKRMYRLWPNNIDSLYNRLVREKLESYYDNGKKAWFAVLNAEQTTAFKRASFIDSLEATSNFLTSSSKKIFHVEAELQWSIENIGPLVVPKKGLTIPLNQKSYIIYHKTILMDEGNDVQFTNGEFTVNGEIATTYTFKNDYYYVLGDNFDRSIDSRQFGFIKGEYIIGKAVLLLYRSGNRHHEGAFCATIE